MATTIQDNQATPVIFPTWQMLDGQQGHFENWSGIQQVDDEASLNLPGEAVFQPQTPPTCSHKAFTL